ncbi:hypothetical protein [Streptomyces sp. H27-D2]|uniref:hypothetical protein n=1 Tax=Streptomyces sp. H27-D2 TaxID=3046304 RepID=UPI002DB98B21|nr:hypothetical protein [Streptomyces sp. H27-D2]MEC4016240.1 hypothetical protein [Streptomyces sp. H27-D2]
MDITKTEKTAGTGDNEPEARSSEAIAVDTADAPAKGTAKTAKDEPAGTAVTDAEPATAETSADARDDLGEDLDDLDDDEAAAPARTGVLSGAGAVVGTALGFISISGSWLGTLMAERQQLLGQIKLQGGKASDQVQAVYANPWHTTALFNGAFALVAIVLGGAVLLRPETADGPRPVWVKALAWGGVALGLIGLLIAVGMYFDLFANLPTVPKTPAQPQVPGQ